MRVTTRLDVIYHLKSILAIIQHVTAETQQYQESICLQDRSMLCRDLEASMA